MKEKFHIHEIETKMDIAMEQAEFIIGVNDEELEDPNNPSSVNVTALLVDFLEQRLRRGDMRLSVSIESTHWYDRNYVGKKNTACRGVKITCNLGDCEWEGPCTDHECYYRFWKEAVLDVAKSLMTYLSQDRAKVYFRGKRNSISIIQKDYI